MLEVTEPQANPEAWSGLRYERAPLFLQRIIILLFSLYLKEEVRTSQVPRHPGRVPRHACKVRQHGINPNTTGREHKGADDSRSTRRTTSKVTRTTPSPLRQPPPTQKGVSKNTRWYPSIPRGGGGGEEEEG